MRLRSKDLKNTQSNITFEKECEFMQSVASYGEEKFQ